MLGHIRRCSRMKGSGEDHGCGRLLLRTCDVRVGTRRTIAPHPDGPAGSPRATHLAFSVRPIDNGTQHLLRRRVWRSGYETIPSRPFLVGLRRALNRIEAYAIAPAARIKWQTLDRPNIELFLSPVGVSGRTISDSENRVSYRSPTAIPRPLSNSRILPKISRDLVQGTAKSRVQPIP